MPKSKEFLHPPKKKTDKKRKNELPESENEYLAAGVDLEEAGEKWRAGDAAKSLRFFLRAIETYDAGLQRFSHSFDLAYNKARLQYEVAQQPRLLVHLPTPLIELLQTALDSHRYALKIQQDSPDLLFNTAQVLTSVAEAITGGKNSSDENQNHALALLQEALELFQRCLNLQEFKYNQIQEDASQVAEPSPDHDAETSNFSNEGSNVSKEEVWTSIEEPITPHTLFDTAIAQSDTLTAICSLNTSQSHSSLAWIEEYYRTILQAKVDFYSSGSEHQHEATLAKGKFTSAISDIAFRNGRLDLPTYERELASAFTSPEFSLDTDPQGLCDRADAELTLVASVQASVAVTQPAELAQIATTCWKHTTKALESLTAASKLSNALNVPRIHLRRGDCELLRLRLAEAPCLYDLAIKSMPTLLKNAEVFYRSAGNLAKQSKDDEESQRDAESKGAIVAALNGDAQGLLDAIKTQRDYAEAIVGEMRDENLLGDESLRKIENLFV